MLEDKFYTRFLVDVGASMSLTGGRRGGGTGGLGSSPGRGNHSASLNPGPGCSKEG